MRIFHSLTNWKWMLVGTKLISSHLLLSESHQSVKWWGAGVNLSVCWKRFCKCVCVYVCVCAMCVCLIRTGYCSGNTVDEKLKSKMAPGIPQFTIALIDYSDQAASNNIPLLPRVRQAHDEHAELRPWRAAPAEMQHQLAVIISEKKD